MAARGQLSSIRGTVCTRLRTVRCPHSPRSLLPPDTSQVRNSSHFGLLPDLSSVSITLSFRSSPPFINCFYDKILKAYKSIDDNISRIHLATASEIKHGSPECPFSDPEH